MSAIKTQNLELQFTQIEKMPFNPRWIFYNITSSECRDTN